MNPQPALEVKDLTIELRLPDGTRAVVVEGVSFAVAPGESLGIVGESGSGKSMTALAIMGLLPPVARLVSGGIFLDGEPLVGKSETEMRRIRGRRISMVLQDPMTALDPSFNVRSQLTEPLRQHRRLSGQALDQATRDALEQVRLSATNERLRQYPHQLSGGMSQRVVSAIALAGQPRVLIADEPTSALDVTTQAHYLALLKELQEKTGFALVLVAHDLLMVRHVCTQLVAMYAGQVVEAGLVEDVFQAARHPYVRAMLAAVPELGSRERLQVIDGVAPDLSSERLGCRFAPRCPYARVVCTTATPALTPAADDVHRARCFGTEPGGWIWPQS